MFFLDCLISISSILRMEMPVIQVQKHRIWLLAKNVALDEVAFLLDLAFLWKAPGMTIWTGLLNVIRKLGSMKLPNLCYIEIVLKLILAYAYLAFMYISNFVICCHLKFWNYV
nr:uncharacterized protein LOC113700481 [Coffea arabica]